jgi:predicted SAM-dependent methyltransferase
MKLNIGCGTDYREGFINIDGSSVLPRVDKVIDISSEELTSHFKSGEIKHILANDIIEHHFSLGSG